MLITSSGAFAQNGPAVVEIQTNLGTIAIELDHAKAPISADNFASYVDSGFYTNTLFHRVVKGFVAQGGGISRIDGKPKTTLPPIANESNNGLSNLAGTVAMARTSDPNSATSQFYINLVDNNGVAPGSNNLDYGGATRPGYAVFGRVIKGMNVARAMEALPSLSSLAFTTSSTLVWIDAAHANDVWDTTTSVTRIGIEGQGAVISEPAGIDCGATCSLSLPASGKIKIKAAPAAGYAFAGWRGDCRGARTFINLDLARGNHNCVAQFNKLGLLTQ